MIVTTAQCLNGVAVIHFPVCLVPLLRHRGRLCQPNKALVSNTKRHCCWSIVTCSASYHIESDGVTVFWSEVQLQSPRGIMGVNLPRTVLLQARESTIISQSRWKGLQYCFPLSSVGLYCWNLVWYNASGWEQQPSGDNEWWNPHEIRWKLQYRQSDSSFICEVMIVEVCLSAVCVCFVFFCLVAGKYQLSFGLWFIMEAGNDIRAEMISRLTENECYCF